MKRRVWLIGMVTVLLVAGVAVLPTARQEAGWWQAARADTAGAYQRYLSDWPDGRHAGAAARRKDDRVFTGAMAANDRTALEAYLSDYPEGRHVDEAWDRREDFIWQEVQAANAVAALEEYLARPEAKYRTQAETDLDRMEFERARSAATVGALDGYLNKFKEKGAFLDEARTLREDVRWRFVQSENRVMSYESYLKEYPSGRYVAAAQSAIEEINWAIVAQTNTIAAYLGFQSRFTGSVHLAEAESRIAALAADPAPWAAADKTATRKGYQDFLAAYPGHQQEATARDRLGDMDGRNFFDLLAAGKISATAKGNGMETVIVTMQSKVAHQVKVNLPAGTYFLASNTSYPNMVARADATITLNSGAGEELYVDAASATHFRGTPYNQNSFTIQRTPTPADLAQLTAVLARARPSYTAAQAAIWMVTNNTNWTAMGSLVVSWSSNPSLINTRSISYTDAVRAMQLLDDAGFNIRTRAIWADRQLLLNNLSDGPLKLWLQAKVSGPTS